MYTNGTSNHTAKCAAPGCLRHFDDSEGVISVEALSNEEVGWKMEQEVGWKMEQEVG